MIRLFAPVWLLLCLLVCLLGGQAWAASHAGTGLGGKVVVTRFSVPEGLFQTTIDAIHQTQDGFLWLATQAGLVRFDGKRFLTFDRSSSPVLEAAYLRAVLEDRGGVVWIGSQGGGLLSYHRGEDPLFRSVPELAGQFVNTLAQFEPDVLWIGTRNEIIRFSTRELRCLARWPIPEDASGVTGIVKDRKGDVWVGIWGGGLMHQHAGVWENLPADNGLSDDGFVRALGLDPAGRVWVATRAGVSVLQGNSLQPIPELWGGRFLVTQFHFSPDGSIWMGTQQQGAIRFDPSTGQVTLIESGPRAVLALYEDREKNLWLGSRDEGLWRINAAAVELDPLERSPERVQLTAVTEVPNGDLVVTSTTGEVLRLGPDGKIHPVAVVSNHILTAVAPGEGGVLWVGGTRDLIRIDLGNSLTEVPLLGQQLPVYALLTDRNHDLWIGTGGWGVFRRSQNGELQRVECRPSCERLNVRTILEDRAGQLWFGTDQTLYKSSSRQPLLEPVAAFQGKNVLALFESPPGCLWVGTFGQGLIRWKDGKATTLGRVQGLPWEAFYAILEDGEGNFWMSGSAGICRVARHELEAVADGFSEQVAAAVLGREEGLGSAQLASGSLPVAVKRSDGILFFPTNLGLARVDPRRGSHNQVPPCLTIDALRIRGQPVPVVRERIEVAPGRQDIEIDFTLVGLRSPARVKALYRLHGYDRDWIDPGPRRTAFYTNLPPGAYRFQVIGANEDGVWETQGANLEMVLAATFYEQGWFWGLVGIVALLGVVGSYHVRTTRLRYRQERLAEIVAERTRELTRRNQELDAALNSLQKTQADLIQAERLASVTTLVSGIAHELNNPIGFIAGNVQILETYTRFLSRVTSELVRTSRLTSGELQPLTRLGQKDLGTVLEDLGLLTADITEGARRARLIIRDLQNLSVGSQKRSLELVDLKQTAERSRRLLVSRAGLRHWEFSLPENCQIEMGAGHLEQVLINLFDNALRATADDGRIEFRALVEGDMLVMVVRDDGTGMSAEVKTRALDPFFTTRSAGEGSGLGLSIVASIIEKHHGRIWIESSPGKGCAAHVVLPLAQPR